MQTAPRADLFRQLCVAKSAKYSSMPVVWRLDLTKNLSLSLAAAFSHQAPSGWIPPFDFDDGKSGLMLTFHKEQEP